LKNSNILQQLAVAFLLLIGASVATAGPHASVITQTVDNAARVSLRGNISPFAQSKNDLGAVGDSVPTGTLYLLLGRSSSEQRQLDQYVLGLSTPGSATYRQWITPAEFGASYGANDDDVATVTSWLVSQGFNVEKVSQSKTVIAFSGATGTVRSAFGTEIHKFTVGGAILYANDSDPLIPAALAPVVRGVVGLTRIAPSSQSAASSGSTAKASLRAKPALTTNEGNGLIFFVVPGDAAVIYDTPNSAMNPAYTGATLDGTGVTIGAIEISNLASTSLQDFANYRIAFLGNTSTQAAGYIPTVVVEGTDPGVVDTAGYNFNADLFTPMENAIGNGEISQGLAPGSKTILYVAQTYQQAIQRAVDDNSVSILINANDDCEANLGAAYNAFLNEVYEQAAAQGITVVASSGSLGSGGCATKQITTGNGLAVSGLASTPWDTAVGGTDFQELYNQANLPQYVNTATSVYTYIAGAAPYYTTALSYIPEGAWNNTTGVFTIYGNNQLPYVSPGLTFPASGGGLSSAAVCSGTISSTDGTCSGSLSGYSKPAYQTSLTPNDGVRDVPDIALFASQAYEAFTQDHPSWAICDDLSYDCASNRQMVSPYGGTAAAASAVAGIFALVEQSTGSRLGLVNPTLYKLFTAAPAAFHDITTGNNSVSCTLGSPSCGANGYLEGYNAGTGYDLTTGLGSLDVAKLVANWGKAGLDITTTTLTAGTSASSLGTSTVIVAHGSTVYFTATVKPSAATGNISIVNNSGNQNSGSLALVALSGGSASFSSQALTGGTYAVNASYSGDANDQLSASNSISVTVTPESTTLGLLLQAIDPSTGAVTSSPASVPYGQQLGLTVTPYGTAGAGKGTVPTGSTSVSNGSTSLATQSQSATGVAVLSIPNTSSLTPGSDSLNVAYSGDESYNAVSKALGVTVTKGAVSIITSGVPACSTLKGDWSVEPTCTVAAGVQTDSVGAAPTGTLPISFNGSLQTIALTATQYGTSTGVNVAGAAATTAAIDVASYVGTYLPTWSATYGGDSNYQSGSGTSTTVKANEQVVSEPSGATFALTSSAATAVSPGGQGTSTITITPAGGFMGQVALTCAVSGGSGSYPPTCTIPATSPTFANSTVQTVTLTIATTAATSAAVAVKNGNRTFTAGGTGIAAIGSFLLCGLLIWKRRIATAMFVLLLAGPFLFTLSGCGSGTTAGGGGGTGTTGTPAGTYTVTVTASNPNLTYNQGWVSNPITGSTVVSITVN